LQSPIIRFQILFFIPFSFLSYPLPAGEVPAVRAEINAAVKNDPEEIRAAI
jgi:hypothetical protein